MCKTTFIYCFSILMLNSFWEFTSGYINVRLQDNLCSDKIWLKVEKALRGGSSMVLGDDRNSAAIIHQVWNSTYPGIHASNKISYDCRFHVHSNYKKSPPRGIYTLVTRLKFRRDPGSGKCLDYIQFRDGNRSPTEPYCNDISIDGPGRLIFDERNREVTVNIHIDNEHMIVEPLELRMVLTAHSQCKYTGDFLCDSADTYSCISRHFVRDNITNCMYPCRDEVSCFHDAVSSLEVDTTNVALSAITSFIFTMVGVGFCVWICWKYWICITVQQHAHEASGRQRQRAQQQTLEQRTEQIINVPIIEMPMPPNFDDVFSSHTANSNSNNHYPQPQQEQQITPKDLPPSYESLFPDR
uniref:Uncharacterized protein n=1 Tax=Glossina morsitans morsitans TaxID=37546 RepID=A0A1B0FMV3_GLOMM